MTSLFLSILKVNTKVYYNHALYGSWSSSMLVPIVETKFSFCGNSYMIAKSNINVPNPWLFILSHVFIPPNKSVTLMPFFGSLYNEPNYFNIFKYKHNISMYRMCMNGYAFGNFNRKNLLYIDGHPQTHGNIEEFINISRFSLFSANCSFEEHSNNKDFFMKKKTSKFVVVHAIRSLSPSAELLINYSSFVNHQPLVKKSLCWVWF